MIKLERIDEAKVVFDQAKSKGVTGEGFDQIEKRLNADALKRVKNQDPPQRQLQPLIAQ